ncbi:MAG TPA: class I SAM-dependent methyltransferase, partial [Rhizomicrobium sp.]|nr:class I SAM-dependent methyltransferase [Rhizomicrobium sp.]
LVILGDRLGLYRALDEHGPATSGELAGKTKLNERLVREWLAAQAAAEYLDYDPLSGRFSLSPEQRMVFADEESPVFLAGGFELMAAVYKDEPKVAKAFQSGLGLGWHEHDVCLFRGTERFFRPGYNANLVSTWIPALEGVEAKLKAGAKVADVGCGMGFSTMLMAQAYPNSSFVGFDFHEPSIREARRHAKTHKAGDNVRFETSTAKAIEERDFDLITVFDCLHDMGDPRGCASHMHKMLKKDGTWMIVEPLAGDRPEDNMNPVSRLYYNGSTMICVPTSLDQEVGEGLGAQAGEARIREIVSKAGFSSVRRAAEGPFNMVLEARW